MGLLSSLFSRSNPDPAQAADADSGDSVAQARTRARQRLMGAVVLVGIGIIGFPLLFETQPRPIAVDVPIEIPRKDNAPPLTLPTARAPAAKAPVVPPAEPVREGAAKPADKAAPAMITETAAEAGLVAASKPLAAKALPPVAPPKVVAKVDEKPEPKPEPKAEPKPEPKPTPKPADSAEAARAQALLEGKGSASAPPSAQRFIVQVGAFADPALARETRLKVERLGLVTYTHVAKTADGDRTRVRVGPVTTRQEADKIAARIKGVGLPAAILTL